MCGPGPRDLCELKARLALWNYDMVDFGEGMSMFLVEFVRSLGNNQKKWSYRGMLPSLTHSDPRDWLDIKSDWMFDPTNRVYARVVRELCPQLATELSWQYEPTDETCGDCVEALLGVAMYCPESPDWRPVGVDIRLRTAARCFRLMSYTGYRVCRILTCYQQTIGWLPNGQRGERYNADEVALFGRADQFYNNHPGAASHLC
jgi:hypothetical protein